MNNFLAGVGAVVILSCLVGSGMDWLARRYPRQVRDPGELPDYSSARLRAVLDARRYPPQSEDADKGASWPEWGSN